jgi:hypothetical protein
MTTLLEASRREPHLEMPTEKPYRQAEVVTVQNSSNPLNPNPSRIEVCEVKKLKTLQSTAEDLKPTASCDSPTLVGNPEVPLKEDGK